MAKPSAPVGSLRNAVRAVLCISPGVALTDAELCDFVRQALPIYEAADGPILDAAEWNLGKGYIEDRKNEDTDEREWNVTKSGIEKQRTA